MRHDDIDLVIKNDLSDVLFIDKYLDKNQKQRSIIHVLSVLYKSYEVLYSLVDDYYKTEAEKRKRIISIAKHYIKASLAASSALISANLLGDDPSLMAYVSSVNMSLIGGYLLCKANPDTIYQYSLDSNERKRIKKQFEAHDQLMSELIYLYIYAIDRYLPYLNLSNNNKYIDELYYIFESNKEYVSERNKQYEYNEKFCFDSVYAMHKDLFEGVSTINNLVDELKKYYNENGKKEIIIKSKLKKRE